MGDRVSYSLIGTFSGTVLGLIPNSPIQLRFWLARKVPRPALAESFAKCEMIFLLKQKTSYSGVLQNLFI